MALKRMVAHLLVFVLAVTWVCPAPAFALRQPTVEGSGLEELQAKLAGTGDRPPVSDVVPGPLARTGLEEGTPITQEAAAGIVRGWEDLAAPKKQAVMQSLREHGVTRERYDHLRSLVLREEKPGEGHFAGFPPVLDGRPNGADHFPLLRKGTDPTVRKRQGVVIAAGGEGTRLLQGAVKAGLLPPEDGRGRYRYVKPTVPLMPVTGKSALAVQLETFAAEAKQYGVPLPVVVVIHQEAGQRVRALLKENGNFGLKHVKLVVQKMNPALDKDTEGRIVLRDDHTVSFNPDGTGGVVRAAMNPTLERWFRRILGPEGHLFLSNGDMLLDREMIQLVSGASAESPLVGVAYAYPAVRDPKDPSQYQSKLGTFAVVNRSGEKRVEIVEYKERRFVTDLKEAIEKREREGDVMSVQANSGLYVFPLEGLATRAAQLTDHVQWDKDALRVPDTVEKVEYFATDLPRLHDSNDVKILSVDPAILKPIKDPAALKEVRELAIQRERQRAMALGFDVEPAARVEFHPAATRGLVHVGRNVRVQGAVGLYVAQDRVKLYTTAQPATPWQPFDPTVFKEAFIAGPGKPIIIPDNTLFSPTGIHTPAGLEEVTVQAPDVSPGHGAADFLQREVNRNPILLAAEAYVRRADVQQRLHAGHGSLILDQEVASALAGRPAWGGALVADGAEGLLPRMGVIWADRDLPIRPNLPWITLGSSWTEQAAVLRRGRIRHGDLLVTEGVPATQVRTTLDDAFPALAQRPRAIVGDRAQLAALPDAAFPMFAAAEGLPAVVDLAVALRVQDEAGQRYTLLLWV